MDSGKYIIYVRPDTIEVAIMFDKLLSHDGLGFIKRNIVAAGFFVVAGKPREDDPGDIEICVWGESKTLDRKSRKGVDEDILKKTLRDWDC